MFFIRMLRKINNKGAVAVEFALIIPVLLLFMFGIIEFGRVMWINSSLQYSVEKAARYVITNNDATDAEITAYAENHIYGLSLDGIAFSSSTEEYDGVVFITIIAAYTFEPLVDFLSFGDIDLEGRTRIPISN